MNLAQDVLVDGEADDQEDDGRNHDAGIIVLEIRAFSMFHEDTEECPECRHHEDDVVYPVIDRRYGGHDQDHEADGQPDARVAQHIHIILGQERHDIRVRCCQKPAGMQPQRIGDQPAVGSKRRVAVNIFSCQNQDDGIGYDRKQGGKNHIIRPGDDPDDIQDHPGDVVGSDVVFKVPAQLLPAPAH